MIGTALKSVAAAAGLILAAATIPAQGAAAADAICYNCPPEWADWASQLAAIKSDLGLDVPHDNKNSGQTLAQLAAERANPVADVAYYGVSFGIQAAEQGLVEPYRPAGFDEIDPGLKAADGSWFSIHSGTIGLFVNKAALGDLPVPQSWEDLLNPQYEGMVGYLDPTSAFVGYAGAVAINRAFGGDFTNWQPGIDFFKKLAGNDPIVPKQTSYARVLSGEIPIMIDYDFNAYRARYKDKGDIEFVIPKEGTLVVPYVMSLVKGAPHADNGRRILDFVLSEKGQSLWANAYLRPVREVKLPAKIEARFLPAADYARAKPVDYAAMAAGQKAFAETYLAEVK